jgi:hypothetical protein
VFDTGQHSSLFCWSDNDHEESLMTMIIDRGREHESKVEGPEENNDGTRRKVVHLFFQLKKKLF